MRLLRITAIGAALAGMALAPAVANAGPVRGPQVSVVAKKLDNPRGLTLAPGGLFVAEAGKGGNGPCLADPEDPTSKVCLGKTGAVTFVGSSFRGSTERWWQQRVVTGLPSLAGADGSAALGPHHVSPYTRGSLVATIGLGGSPTDRATLGNGGKLLGTVVTLKPGEATVTKLADLAAYEAKKNPDGGDPGSSVDSNPYGVLGTPWGAVATDAGGNDLLSIDRKGKVSTLAVFHARFVNAPPPPNGPGGQIPMQAVPTSVVRGPDGAYYVSQLTGFPFPVGAANIYRVVPGHAPTVYARGFTNVVDLQFDRWGRLLVLEIAKNGLLSGDETGALIRVDKKGKKTELVPNRLTAPGGLAIAPDGTIFVSNKSILAGGGEILRIRNA
jgi:hypothetical protein